MSNFIIEEYRVLAVSYEVTEFMEKAAVVSDSVKFFAKKRNKEKLTKEFLEEVDRANKTEPRLGARLSLYDLVESEERMERGTLKADENGGEQGSRRTEPSIVFRLTAKVGVIRPLSEIREEVW